jgi:hypothetical protein
LEQVQLDQDGIVDCDGNWLQKKLVMPLPTTQASCTQQRKQVYVNQIPENARELQNQEQANHSKKQQQQTQSLSASTACLESNSKPQF